MRRVLAHLSDNVTVEEWTDQTYWRWVVAHAYAKGCREVKAYTTKASALRGGRRFLAALKKGK